MVRVFSSIFLVVAASTLLQACGGDPSDKTEESPSSCTSSEECAAFCGVPMGTPLGTTGLTGTCFEDMPEDDGCIVVVEGGEAVSAVCE